MSDSFPAGIHYQRIGESGHTVVFLHGLFGQGKNFTGVARHLEPKLRSVLMDVPNHGDSVWTETFDYLELADMVAEAIYGLDDERPVHLVGHSMGGKLAMVVALRHPELIDRLVVVDISPVSSSDTSEFEHLLGSLAALDISALSSRSQAQEQLREAIPSDMVRGFLLQSLVREGDEFRWKPQLELLLRSLPAISEFPQLEVAAFEHPVLWIAGDKSPYIRPEHSEPMRALFPLVRQLRIKDAGHWVHAEKPQVFSAAVQNFLTR